MDDLWNRRELQREIERDGFGTLACNEEEEEQMTYKVYFEGPADTEAWLWRTMDGESFSAVAREAANGIARTGAKEGTRLLVQRGTGGSIKTFTIVPANPTPQPFWTAQAV